MAVFNLMHTPQNTMLKHFLFILTGWLLALSPLAAAPGEVLIVADEIPAMQVLAKALKAQEGINSTIVLQTALPASLEPYQAVIVYIHKALHAGPEKAFIDYTRQGGKLILLHHTISSIKRENAHWFDFMGIDLLKKDVSEGGYKWKEKADMELVNLAPRHFITSHKVNYEQKFAYTSEAGGKKKKLPGFALRDTEVYLNHVYLRPRTILMGFSYTDETGKVWMQDRSAWCMPAGKGWIFYAQPGHTKEDFAHPVYARILANAVIFDHAANAEISSLGK